MNYQTVNIFPTTIYIGEIENHTKYKQIFLNEIYEQYQFPHQSRYGGINTVSENCGKPILHLENELFDLFQDISEHILNYCHQTLLIRDIFDVQIMKSWISRSYSNQENIPEHKHSTSQISFVYYLNADEKSNELTFMNTHKPNLLFDSLDDLEVENDEESMIHGFNFETTPEYNFSPCEGTVILFPSQIHHKTSSANDEVHKFERLAIVGDAILTLKKDQPMIYSQGFISPQYWKTFSRK